MAEMYPEGRKRLDFQDGKPGFGLKPVYHRVLKLHKNRFTNFPEVDLGGVMASVPATRPKGVALITTEGDGFSRAI
jgi:hypothetical protein